MTAEGGYFIDWNGNARSVQDPGGNFTIEVDMPSKYVALYSKGGTLMHEATFYRSLEDISKKGITAELVPGSHPWGMRNEW